MSKPKKVKKERDRSVFREYFELIAETAVFVFFVMTFVVQAFQIPTGSMESTLLVGDFLLVNKFAYARTVLPLEDKILPHKKLDVKDIIVFRYPEDLTKDYVKRVIALEGDIVEIRDKQVFVNGIPLAENYKVHIDSSIIPGTESYRFGVRVRDNFGPLTVPRGHCFAMGDNRDNSQDSRVWGTLPLKYVKGRPWVIYFSYDAEREAHLKTGAKERLQKYGRFITRARLNRLLHVIR
jgi:signal peptidase I